MEITEWNHGNATENRTGYLRNVYGLSQSISYSFRTCITIVLYEILFLTNLLFLWWTTQPGQSAISATS
jgi:hypothetical protein